MIDFHLFKSSWSKTCQPNRSWLWMNSIQGRSGVAARTRVFSQTEQSESEVVTLLMPLLLFALFRPCPASASGTKTNFH